MARQQVRGVMIIPEKFRLLNTVLTHVGTRYRVFADRAKSIELLDSIFTGTKKDSFTYFDDTLYDDQIIYFTTNMQLSDDSWCGESPLTRVVLRREQVSSTGIIVTPSVSIDKLGLSGGFNISASEFIRYEGTSAHDSSTYRIEDEITGDVVFEKEDDRDNLLSIKTPENILKPNRVYRISVRFKDTVGRYSNYGSVLYNYSNMLYTMFPNETITAMYGSNIIIENNASERIISDDVLVVGRIDGEIVYTGIMLNNKIIIDSKQFSIGDIVTLTISLNDNDRDIMLYISKVNTAVKYDTTFELSNVFESIALDLDMTIDDGGTTRQEFKDGYIYDFINSNQLVRYRYDDMSKKLTDYSDVMQYDVTIPSYTKRFIENPIDGNIIMISQTANSDITQYITIIDINTYNILTVIPVESKWDSAIYSQQPLIIDNILYLINYGINSAQPILEKMVHTLDLNTYIIELKGTISFDSLEVNLAGTLYCGGYNQLLYKGEIYFINNGGDHGLVNTVGKVVYKLNRSTLILETVGVLNIDTSLYGGAYASVLTTLKNGKPALIFSKCSYTSSGSPVRTITGIYYIDLDTMTVDVTNMVTGIAHTNTHTTNVLLNDGTFLFFNSTECVHFK